MANETQTPDQANLYCRQEQDGSVIPLDPLTGNTLQPGVIPESLLADEELRQGFTFLKENADSIRFTLLLGPHGDAASFEQAGIDLRAEAQKISEADGVLFLEGVSSTEEARQSHQATLNQTSHLPAAEAEEYRDFLNRLPTRNSFATETDYQLAGTGVRVSLPDYAKESGRLADQTLAQWDHYIDKQTWPRNTAAKTIEWHSLKLGYVIYRDMYWLGKMGHTLATLQEQRLLGDPIEAGMVAGSAHSGVGRNLEQIFGVNVTYRGEYGEHLDEVGRRFARAVGKAVLTQEDQVDIIAGILISAGDESD